jgi:hypothetical protein
MVAMETGSHASPETGILSMAPPLSCSLLVTLPSIVLLMEKAGNWELPASNNRS